MSVEWEQVTVATKDPVGLGRWWCEVLGWVVVDDGPVVFEIQRQEDQLPGLLFLATEDDKHDKNRLHIDLRPDNQEAEVARLLAMGATRIDIGQGDVPWVVMADPDGNEFCVLGERQPAG